MPRSQDCPRCSCPATFRVHRKPKEYFLLGWRAFCCLHCRRRFLRFDLGKLLHWQTASYHRRLPHPLMFGHVWPPRTTSSCERSSYNSRLGLQN